TGAVGGVAQVLGRAGVRRLSAVGSSRRCGGGRERQRLVLGAGQLPGGRGLGHGDELGALLDLRDGVGAAVLLRRNVEGLGGLVAVLDDQPEAVGRALALLVGHLHGQRAALPRGESGDRERAEPLRLSRRQRGRGGGTGDLGTGGVLA